MGEKQLYLPVPGFIQRTEGCHIAPGSGTAKSRHTRFAKRGLILRDCNGTIVCCNGRLPSRINLVEEVRTRDRPFYRVGHGVLVSLILHVLAIGELVWLIPLPPFFTWNISTVPGHLWGKSLIFRNVSEMPVHITREIIIVRATQLRHGFPPLCYRQPGQHLPLLEMVFHRGSTRRVAESHTR